MEYTFAELERFSHAGTSLLRDKLPLRRNSDEKELVVAILGPSTLDYLVSVLTLSRLGFTVLFLSTRISGAAYESLLKATDCSHMLIDPFFEKSISGVRQTIPNLQTINILCKEQYDNVKTVAETATTMTLDPAMESHRVAWIIHSSGSTGLPKPIFQTHKAALRNYENNMNRRGFITLPLFHAHGVSSVFRSFTACKKIFMYNASLPLTGQNLIEILSKYRFQIFYGVPYALKLLAESTEGIEALAAIEVVMFGGSACPDALGDLLVGNGVNLISHYGTTETGQLMTSFRPDNDKAWDYVRVHDRLEPFIRFEDRGGNLFELVVLDGWPSKVASNRDDGDYATKDLFEPHPIIPGAWKFGGRLDDTIVLLNGEKAIPLAMEGAVRQQKVVQDAVMFGSGKSQLGMMIIASSAAANLSESQFIDAIWPAIEKENLNSPAYAQLCRDAIHVLTPGSPYPQTDKGTLIRQAFYKDKAEEIEELYKQLEKNDSKGTLVLDFVETCDFLRTQIINIAPGLSPEEIGDTIDLFSLGVDSLQSTRLRAIILQEIQLNGKSLPQNFVFENPSLAKMAEAVIDLREGRADAANKDVEKEMSDLVSRYAMFSKQHTPRPRTSNKNCVVVTGATGSLGAHLITKIAARSDVDEVCCLVRAGSDEAARRRVYKSLKQRALLHSLPLSSGRKIIAYPANISKPCLGLSGQQYEHLVCNLGHIIHCAWSVNFNKQLSSFEADCIAGTKNLISLCLAVKAPKPASLSFCSSVSAVANTPGGFTSEALPEGFSFAQGIGYAQSKLVTEIICSRARAETGIDARVLRVGQIVADSVHGIWNDTEAIPLMLQAATTIGALPALDESPRWLPVDDVAETILDISLSTNAENRTFFNVVNPETFHWTRDLLPAMTAAGVEYDQVEQREWIRRLRASNPDPAVNPTIKLVEFFAGKYERDATDVKAAMDYETTAAESLSPILASRPKTGQDPAFVSKFVSRFLSSSWAAPTSTTSPSSDKDIALTKLVVLAGPCGSGKSTIALGLADRLETAGGGITPHIIEGDSVHDAIAIAKMGSGFPLSDVDREIWLSRLRIEVLEYVRAMSMVVSSSTTPEKEGEKTRNSQQRRTNIILLTCSALKHENRHMLRNLMPDGSIETNFVLLQARREELVRRVGARKGHYMKAHMVESQLEILEQPGVEEVDVLPVDTERNSSTAEIVADVVHLLELN